MPALRLWLAIASGAVASGLGYAIWYTVLPSLRGRGPRLVGVGGFDIRHRLDILSVSRRVDALRHDQGGLAVVGHHGRLPRAVRSRRGVGRIGGAAVARAAAYECERTDRECPRESRLCHRI